MIVKTEIEKAERSIRNIIALFVGCSILFAVVSVSYIVFVIIELWNSKWTLSTQQLLLFIGAILLLWQMGLALSQRCKLPSNYKQISKSEFPILFTLINKVASSLKVAPPNSIFISPHASAAVFTLPDLRNIFFKPERNLILGMGILSQMDDAELEAILYHEFGHYVQKEMDNTISVYHIGLFSKSFVTIRNSNDKMNIWHMQIKGPELLFRYFTTIVCTHITQRYAKLSQLMEFEADDIAVRHVGAHTLRKALLHAVCIRHNCNLMNWGLMQLADEGIAVRNYFSTLSSMECAFHPQVKNIRKDIRQRIARLDLPPKISANPQRSCYKIKEEALVFSSEFSQVIYNEYFSNSKPLEYCEVNQFIDWLQLGMPVYRESVRIAKSVRLEIHLTYRKHRLPLIDSFYDILLDGKIIGKGNFIKGYTLVHNTNPGKHLLEIRGIAAITSVPFYFETDEGNTYRLEMDFKVRLLNGSYTIFCSGMSLL